MTARRLVAILGVLAGMAGWAEGSLIIGGQTIPAGPVVMKFVGYDVGSLYNVPDGTYSGESTLNGLSQTPSTGAAPGEDSWGIFRIDTIQDATQTVTYYNRYTASEEITGIFWGEQDSYLQQSTVSGQITQDIHGRSMHVAIFRDAAMNFTPAAGPGARATPAPAYATATDGQLIWSFNSTPGWDITFPDDEFFTTFRPNATGAASVSANGGFFARTDDSAAWGAGAWNNLVDPNGIAQGVAARFDFTGNPGPYGWIVRANDPIEFTIIPEPASLVLLLSGAGWVIGRAGRRARQ